MTKNVKDPSHAKAAEKKAPAPANTVEPAQEIADDEVEIAETGGKPGEEGTPITDRK
jgi:hypothetical protein